MSAVTRWVICPFTPASAAQFMFSFSPSGSQLLGAAPYSGSGIFTTSDTSTMVGGQTAVAITGISGTINGSAINNAAGGNYGNYFTTGNYFLDGSGVNITTASGIALNFFNQSSNNLYRINATNPFTTFYVAASSSAVAGVPEPAAWALMVGGFGMVGAAMRQRRRAVASYA